MKPRYAEPLLAALLVALALGVPGELCGGMTSAEIRAYNTVSTKAQNGDAIAQYNLGVCYSSGLGIKMDSVQAISWWRKSAAQGNAPAMYNLGYSYVDAIGVKVDLAQGVAWYRKSAELGHVPAMCNLGICYDEGVGVAAEVSEAIKWLGRAAAKGDAAAAVRLDLIRSRLEAFKNRLADSGNKSRGASGAFTQPSENLNGTLDKEKAFTILKLKAEKGDPVSQHILGISYQFGFSVAKDPVLAVKWFRLSADQGNAYAKYSLGFCYKNGVGVLKDPEQGVWWIRKSADQGFAMAQSYLGFCLEIGDGMLKDPPQAITWYRKAAEQGFARAQLSLGNCYENGIGVLKDDIEAYAYYNLAGITNDAARSKLSILEIRISPEDRLRGRQRSKELLQETESKKATRGTSDNLDKFEQSRKVKESELMRKGA